MYTRPSQVPLDPWVDHRVSKSAQNFDRASDHVSSKPSQKVTLDSKPRVSSAATKIDEYTEANVVYYEMGVQTEPLRCDDKNFQTDEWGKNESLEDRNRFATNNTSNPGDYTYVDETVFETVSEVAPNLGNNIASGKNNLIVEDPRDSKSDSLNSKSSKKSDIVEAWVEMADMAIQVDILGPQIAQKIKQLEGTIESLKSELKQALETKPVSEAIKPAENANPESTSDKKGWSLFGMFRGKADGEGQAKDGSDVGKNSVLGSQIQ